MLLRASLIAGPLAALFLCACTPSGSPTFTADATSSASSPVSTASTPPSSQTPTSTWSADQAAAIEAVDAYWAAIARIEANPAGFNESQMKAILKMVAGDEVVASNVGSYLSLKKRGFRYDGSAAALQTWATGPSNPSYGLEVVVTRCVDQRSLRVLNQAGAEVSEAELGYRIPDFNLRQYTVVKAKSDAVFRVYGLAPAKGDCGP